MPQQALPEQYDIERLDHPETQTEERERMADVLDEHWGTGKTLAEMAEIAGYSRQHVKNTLSSHYRMIEKDDETDEITITIPDNVDARSYLKGVTDAMEAQ